MMANNRHYYQHYDFRTSPEQEFYYGGVYPHNENKRRSMPSNIRRDFEPFTDFLHRSIKSKQSATSVGAEFRLPEKEEALVPCDTLIKADIATAKSFTVPLPKETVYFLSFDSETDMQEIEEISIGRNDVIWQKGDFLEQKSGSVFLKLRRTVENNQKIKVWFADDDCNGILSQVDYEDFSSYRIKCDSDCTVQSVSRNENLLSITYNGKFPHFVEIFGEQLVATEEKAKDLAQAKIAFILNNKKSAKVAFLRDNFFLLKNAVIHTFKDGVLTVDSARTKYAVCTNEELRNYIADARLHLSANAFSCDCDENFSSDTITFNGINFKKGKNTNKNWMLKLKDRNKKNVGTVIELLEDESFKNDIYSNLDIFFAESTEALSDEPTTKRGDNRRKFAIGWTDKNNGLMEIAEKVKGEYRKIDFTELLDKKLYVVADISELKKQKMALNRLMFKPLPDHKLLLELTDKKEFAEWEEVHPADISDDSWYKLTDLAYEGCEQQRQFVRTALGTSDFAILDGPPGSGKTTTILEIIAQAITRGQKVMLAASTNAAVDNILERLDSLPDEVQEKIFAVRLGSDSISKKVEKYNVNKIENPDLRNEVIMRANVVCSTIFGILKHPSFNLEDNAQPAIPLYDYLIVDEASKTTFQDFLVPALYAKHWILSGDLRQLTPYTEQEDLENALKENSAFPTEYQYVQTIFCLLKKNKRIFEELRLCIPIKAEFLKAVSDLSKEINPHDFTIGILTKKETHFENAASKEEFLSGDKNAVYVFGCTLLFVDDEIYEEMKSYLPSDFVPVLSYKNDYFFQSTKCRSF